MKTAQDVREIMDKALIWEERAEKNCEKILQILTTNGFHDSVEHIKNDEVQHQEWVKQLIRFLD
jgi:bacterioferritin (cytochrome b1)